MNSIGLSTSTAAAPAHSGHRISSRRFVTLASALLVTVVMMMSSGIGPVSAAGAARHGGSGPSRSQLVFTHNGSIVGQLPAPPKANDLHYVWSKGDCKGNSVFPYVKLFWTYNGKIISDPLLAPCRANDFEFAWNADGTITTASWTYDGKPMQQLIPPQGANDVHLFLTGKTHLVKAWWTYNGKPLQSIRIPTYVNDMHWYGYPIPAVTNGQATELVFTKNGKIVGQTTSPANANDLHYVWTKGKCKGNYAYPYVRLVWTIKGQVLKPVIKAPCRANDFEFSWDANGMVTGASWTHDGMVMGSVPFPAGVVPNDAHLYLAGDTRLLSAWWTYNGQPITRIKLPGYVNDMHWFGYPTTQPVSLPKIADSFYS